MSKPSPALLRSFEAAARLGSLTLAAAELGVTPGAIGHAVRGLEDWAGQPLLRRDGRKLVPTDHAQRVLPDLAKGFAVLDAAANLMRFSSQSVLTIAVDTSFAALWLVPRLAAYQKTRQAVATRIVQPSFPDPLATPDVDVALLYRRPTAVTGSELTITELLQERVFPLCAPQLRAPHPRAPHLKRKTVRNADFPHHRPLLHIDVSRGDEDYPTWHGWCRLAGHDPDRAAGGSYFSHAIMALDAAAQGQGIVLTGDVMAAEFLASGRLVKAVDDPPVLMLPRYLVHRRLPEPRAELRRFCDFLRKAALDDAP